MSFSGRFILLARQLLPMPFTIAVILTILTIVLALIFTEPTIGNSAPHFIQVLEFWEMGFWDLLTFAMQMMLMLVFGHVLALTKPVNKIISKALVYCNNTASAAGIVTLLTVLVALFNWGLGLIFGAIFARKIAEYASEHNIEINYPLVGAAGYSGLMVWHGGLSGSAPIKAAEEGHFLMEQIGRISLNETIFSSLNITISILLIILLPVSMYFIGKRSSASVIRLTQNNVIDSLVQTEPEGAEKLDNSKLLAYLFGGMLLLISIYKVFIKPDQITLEFLNPNFINLFLLGLGIVLYGNFRKYLSAIDTAILGASGIMIQFPLYAGIMGVMQYSGLVVVFSDFFVGISNQVTLPIFTFISAAIVNIFVPSGGGQWAVQGPIIVEAAKELGVSIPKCIMALSYGDQLTNMIQPFWALPLLGITGLKAKEILPYTLYLMCIGVIIFVMGLLLF